MKNVIPHKILFNHVFAPLREKIAREGAKARVCSSNYSLLFRLNTMPKRRVFDKGLRVTPLPEGTR